MKQTIADQFAEIALMAEAHARLEFENGDEEPKADTIPADELEDPSEDERNGQF